MKAFWRNGNLNWLGCVGFCEDSKSREGYFEQGENQEYTQPASQKREASVYSTNVLHLFPLTL